jgi:hypothetical protein
MIASGILKAWHYAIDGAVTNATVGFCGITAHPVLATKSQVQVRLAVRPTGIGSKKKYGTTGCVFIISCDRHS